MVLPLPGGLRSSAERLQGFDLIFLLLLFLRLGFWSILALGILIRGVYLMNYRQIF